MCMLDTIRARRGELYQVANRNKAERLYLFGSCVRREEDADSDVDILVDFSDKASLLDHVHLQDAFSHILGRSVDVVSSRGLSRFLSARILAEAQPI